MNGRRAPGFDSEYSLNCLPARPGIISQNRRSDNILNSKIYLWYARLDSNQGPSD